MEQLERLPEGHQLVAVPRITPVSQPILDKPGTPKRVWMVAEDDPVLRSILKMMLMLWEVDSLVFADGHEAWAWLDQVERGDYALPMPEVALLDIRMPGHLGYEVGGRMRAIDATKAIPLLIMTAYHLSDKEKAQIDEAAHPEHLVPKPFPSLDEFRSLIETTIAGARTGSYTLHPVKVGRADKGLLSLAAHQWQPSGMSQTALSLFRSKWGDV
jgi:CheY-like chemotaxis protein